MRTDLHSDYAASMAARLPHLRSDPRALATAAAQGSCAAACLMAFAHSAPSAVLAGPPGTPSAVDDVRADVRGRPASARWRAA